MSFSFLDNNTTKRVKNSSFSSSNTVKKSTEYECIKVIKSTTFKHIHKFSNILTIQFGANLEDANRLKKLIGYGKDITEV